MNIEERAEAHIINKKIILVILSKIEDESLIKDFCGTTIIIDDLTLQNLPSFSNKIVYLCGDISIATSLVLGASQRVSIIREISHGYSDSVPPWPIVDLGQVPILIHGVGVYYRRLFDSNRDYFNLISEDHAFQSLTESTKPGKSHRTGIYLTPVEKDKEGLHFRLLRCSTNLAGPTENFGVNDGHIVDTLNLEADCIFEKHASMNHVLAQVYRNTPATSIKKQAKARIGSHADKTKDMPSNGVMAFCTFYDKLERLQPMPNDAFDYGYKKSSGLTTLRFRLKNSEIKDPACVLPNEFSITLYPNSVFFMPLSTNRFYTHEIRPSALDPDKLPTRLGYVVRCSKTEAVHSGGHTYLKKQGKLTKLEQPTEQGMSELRTLYSEENKTEGFIDYGDNFLFSMNEGDYKAPEYNLGDKFRQYTVPSKTNLFDELSASVKFEGVVKGRQGAVLVNNDKTRGVPIVRTTTKYLLPAQNWKPVHSSLALDIQKCASLPLVFNNALIENYTDKYKKMGFHSDQAQDLADDSFIALFSCYKNPELNHSRKLVVESKEPGGGKFEIQLSHNSVVIFSLDTNRRFRHKIVLEAGSNEPENQWLGITFRNSKTFVKNDGTQTYFEDGAPLKMGNEEECSEFYPLRHRENNETNFRYPQVKYTLSESDMMPPEDLT